MKSLEKFLEFYIDKMIADRPVPIDLNALSSYIGATVEEREMIPEAVMQAIGGRFHIYLQSNFKDFPGTTARRRFTLAHEIGHTLFYELSEGELKPRKDSPRGEGLEAACHKAASMILVPSKILQMELRQREVTGADGIVSLARHFDVSIEVMSRRLHELRVFENDWTPILSRLSGGIPFIEYAAYSHWLIPHIVAPEKGVSFTEWFRGVQQSDGVLKRRVDGGSLDAVRKEITSSLVIFELRLHN